MNLLQIIKCVPGYDSTTLENDISLLRFSSPVKIDNYTAPISLPPAGDDLIGIDGSSCVISGWGTTAGKFCFKLCSQKASTAY